MSIIQYTTEFDATPEAIWPYLEEPDKIKLWMSGVVEDRPTSEGPPRVGSTFELDIKEGRKVGTYQGEITKHDPPRSMGVKMVGGCGKTPMTMYADYILSKTGTNRTRLDYECRCELPQRFIYKLMAPLFRLMGRAMIKKFMRNLRGLVESPQPTFSGKDRSSAKTG